MLAYTSPLLFMTQQSSQTFVSKGNKTSHSCVSCYPWSVDLPLEAAQGGNGFSPGSNKRVMNSLWYSSGTQKEKKNNLSLAPRYFLEWVVMATGYSNCFSGFQDLGNTHAFLCLSFYVCADIWIPELVPGLRRGFEIHARIPLGYTGPQPTSQNLACSAPLLIA